MKTNKNAAVLAKSTALEKGLYGLGQIGMNLCWTFMMMYVTMYYTDSVGISAAVVGTVMLVARLFDGAADVLCSMMFKRTHMKLGKIRPWFMIAAPLLGISLIMSFNVPADWSVSAKGIYVFVTYTFTAAVSYTIVSLAFASFLPLLSYDPIDRTKVSSVGMLMTNSGVVVMNYITPILLALNGGIQAPGAWRTVSLIYAVLSTVFV
ncbi:MAG: MFS transporter, partial [Treponema sp.]|nr:MFS transporter [Treponema sp.]